MVTITKKQFETTYRKFSPSKIELFYIKHISVATLYHNILPTIIGSVGLMFPFLIAFVGKVFNLPHAFIAIPSYIYICIIALMGVLSLVIWHKRQIRIRKIRKELNISKKEYKEIVDKYYYHNYYPDIKDYINSIIDENE